MPIWVPMVASVVAAVLVATVSIMATAKVNTTIIDSWIGCGVCAEVAHAAVLCPSFYRSEIITNPGRWDLVSSLRLTAIGLLQRRIERRLAGISA